MGATQPNSREPLKASLGFGAVLAAGILLSGCVNVPEPVTETLEDQLTSQIQDLIPNLGLPPKGERLFREALKSGDCTSLHKVRRWAVRTFKKNAGDDYIYMYGSTLSTIDSLSELVGCSQPITPKPTKTG